MIVALRTDKPIRQILDTQPLFKDKPYKIVFDWKRLDYVLTDTSFWHCDKLYKSDHETIYVWVQIDTDYIIVGLNDGDSVRGVLDNWPKFKNKMFQVICPRYGMKPNYIIESDYFMHNVSEAGPLSDYMYVEVM